MIQPRVWNKHNPNTPSAAVYIGRGSKWGNQFKIGEHGNRTKVIRLYDDWIYYQIVEGYLDVEELRGKDLVCFCAPLPCHGDILLELANPTA